MTYILNTNNTYDINSSDTITVTGSDYSMGTVTLSGGYTNTVGPIYTTGTVTNWASNNTNFVSSGGKSIMTIPHGEQTVVLEKEATLEVQGNVKINGVDLEERLKTIETLLQIPTRDVTMESKHPKLKQLYEQYMHELEKYKTWDRLNGDKNGTT